MRNIFDFYNEVDKYSHVKSLLLYGDKSLIPSPQMSVIMPVYGNPKFFTDAYFSVCNQRTKISYEIIIVDNTPFDGEKSQIQIFLEKQKPINVLYYRNQENIGMTGNWNRGVSLCRSEVFTFCHDDDMLLPDCLSILWECHLKYPDKFIIPIQRVIDENVHYPLADETKGHITFKKCIIFSKIDIFMGNPTNGVGCLFYKKQVLEIGGYHEEYYPSADNAMHICNIFRYGAMHFPEELYCYRISSSNTSNKVYKAFISNGIFYTQCMISEMNLPTIIGKILSNAYKNHITYSMTKKWDPDVKKLKKVPLFDQFVYKIFKLKRKIQVLSVF